MHPYYETLAKAGLTKWLADGGDARDENGCLLWPDGKTSAGYGMVYREPKKPEYVHRVAYEATVGPIPDDYFIDHVWTRGCRSKACFWPEHLEAVTVGENNQRRWLAFKMSYPRPCGHDWDDNRSGRSDCASCHRDEERRRRRAAGPSRGAQRAALIRQLSAEGWRNADIAARVECSQETVRRVLANEVYRDAA